MATGTQIQVNDVLVAGVAWTGLSTTMTSFDGWSIAIPQFSSGGSGNQIVQYKVATSSDIGQTFTWFFSGAALSNAGIVDYRGADPNSPLDVSGTTNSGQAASNVTLTAPSITTSANNDTLVWIGGGAISSGSVAFNTPPPAFTLDYAFNFAGAALGQQLSYKYNLPAGATGSASTTVSAGTSTIFWHAVMIALKPAAPTTPTAPRRPVYDPLAPARAGLHWLEQLVRPLSTLRESTTAKPGR